MTAILPKPAASSVDVAIELYNELLEVPVVSSARITGNTLEISTSHRSISQLVKRNAAQTLILDSANEVIATTPLVFTSHEVLHTSRSPDGKRTAVYRANGTGKERKLLIEIWETEEGVKLEEFDVGKNHGDWYFDGTFATPSWHPEGHSIVYTAEAPSIPTESPPFASSFVYKPDMGETFTGKKEPTIFLLLLKDSPYRLGQESSSANRLSKDSPSIHRLTNSETKVFGQPCFLPSLDGSTPRIVATSFSLLADGRRLGQVYCTNRPVAVNELILSPTATANDDANEGADEEQTWTAKEIQQISPVGRSARSPRVLFPAAGSNDSYTIVYISNAEGGPHGSCGRLHSLNGILIDTVSAPKSLDSFPGLYTDQIPASPFLRLDSGVFLVVTSIWRSRKVPLLIHLETGEVTCLASWTEPSADPVFPYFGAEAKEMMKSYTVLGTDGGKRIVVTRSSLTSPVEVVVAEVSGGEGIEWKVVKKTKLSARGKLFFFFILRYGLTISMQYRKRWRRSTGLCSLFRNSSRARSFCSRPLRSIKPPQPVSTFLHSSPSRMEVRIRQAQPISLLRALPCEFPTSFNSAILVDESSHRAFAGYRVAWINYPGSLGFGASFHFLLEQYLRCRIIARSRLRRITTARPRHSRRRSNARHIALSQRALTRLENEGKEIADGRLAWGIYFCAFDVAVSGGVRCVCHEESCR